MQAYMKGRDIQCVDELTDVIRENSEATVERVNELLERAGFKSIDTCNSGWRPKSINDVTANAGKASRHLTGEAVDLPDPDRTLASWCVDNLDELGAIGLWMEDPRWTPTWVHLQTVAPRSGKQVYIPSSMPAKDPNFPVTWV